MTPASFVHNPTADRSHGSKRGCFLQTSAVSSPKPETWLNSFLVFHNIRAQVGVMENLPQPGLSPQPSPALCCCWERVIPLPPLGPWPPHLPAWLLFPHGHAMPPQALLYGYLLPLPPTYIRMLAAGAEGSSVGGGQHIPALLVPTATNSPPAGQEVLWESV